MTELNANKRQVFISYAAKSWIKRGTALDDSGNHEEALQAYDNTLALNPNDINAWYNKGRARKV
jgi:tetratricopeptide (TPR) repeat protein